MDTPDKALIALKDLESFCKSRMEHIGDNATAVYAYRDVLFLIRQHIRAIRKDLVDTLYEPETSG